MFQARISVGKDTDVAVEIARLESEAASRLDPQSARRMLQEVEPALRELQRQAVEMSAHGIAISAKKTVAGADFRVELALSACPEPARAKSGPLSWLFGR